MAQISCRLWFFRIEEEIALATFGATFGKKSSVFSFHYLVTLGGVKHCHKNRNLGKIRIKYVLHRISPAILTNDHNSQLFALKRQNKINEGGKGQKHSRMPHDRYPLTVVVW